MSVLPDVHTLTGVYAVNALHAAERAEFERHLPHCPPCAQEVAGLQATSSLLGAGTETEPPGHLRERVLGEVSATRQVPPAPVVAPVLVPPPRAPWLVRSSVLAAAAGVLVVVVLGVQAVQAGRELDAVRQSAAGYSQVSDLLKAPDVQVRNETGSAGGEGTVVMSPSRDRAVFLAEDLPSLAPDRAYQLWVVGPDGPRSAGLVRDEPVVAGGLTGARAIALTVEPSGGSPAPTTTPVLAIPMA
ncbi:anti-sigma factor domain-containing protein [Lentzea sp. NPDC060358]|uniref:anti-sigma factor n=1 Tax=Lentzea sp. NPDC060358 TaxID=3347103 RepID=UPI00364E3709